MNSKAIQILIWAALLGAAAQAGALAVRLLARGWVRGRTDWPRERRR